MGRRLTRTLGAIALFLCYTSAWSGDETHPFTMWRVSGAHNTIYVLGSIHLLREQDHPLPTVIDMAYDDADTIIMEIDMDDLDPVYAQGAFNRAGVLTDETTLRDLLGEDTFQRATVLADAIDVPLDLLNRSEPWLAAVTVEMMMLFRMGFNPNFGVETTLMTRAIKDRKPIEGFETVDEQIAFLDGLSPEVQSEMLLQALQNGATFEDTVDELIAAWHTGKMSVLAADLLDSIEGQSEFYEVLIKDRNRRWVGTITDLLDDDQNYLVVVGALHLVGPDGVPTLLESRGFAIEQLSEPARLR